MSDGETDDGEQVKETFAYFGRAAYMASVVETGLAHALMQIDFLTGVKDEYVKTRGEGFDRKRYEADFDAFMETQFAKTMGNLIKRVNELGAFDDDLKRRISDAKKRRDFLFHHYWREMAVQFGTRRGRAEMIKELDADARTFETLDEDIRDALKPIRKKLGMDEDALDARTEAEMAKLRSDSS